MHNILGFLVVFGNNFKKKFFNFIKNYKIIMEYAYKLENQFYCLSYDKVKNIIEYAKKKRKRNNNQ